MLKAMASFNPKVINFLGEHNKDLNFTVNCSLTDLIMTMYKVLHEVVKYEN